MSILVRTSPDVNASSLPSSSSPSSSSLWSITTPSSSSSPSSSSNSTATPISVSSGLSAPPAASAAAAASPSGTQSVMSLPKALRDAKRSTSSGPSKLSHSRWRSGSFRWSFLSTESTSSAAPRSTSCGCSPNCSWMSASRPSYARAVSRVFGRYIAAASTSSTLAPPPRRTRCCAAEARSSSGSPAAACLRRLRATFSSRSFSPGGFSRSARSPILVTPILPHKLVGSLLGSCASRLRCSAVSTSVEFAR
mmetsp:Transcript_23096/g.68643  ORF Transcript_23096/g.68643 Transcript_23096/m.68643 type:complete len:251 (+) Transcript_23096:6056-6808(+)